MYSVHERRTTLQRRRRAMAKAIAVHGAGKVGPIRRAVGFLTAGTSHEAATAHLRLTGRPARSDFERLLAEAITVLSEDGDARRGRVISWMNDAWFSHLYHPHY